MPWTSSTRRSMVAAWAAISSSRCDLRWLIRRSVSSRMWAISALDQSRIAAMSSSERWRRAAVPSVDLARICSTTSRASASTWDSDCSRATSAVARMAAARSAMSLDGFLGVAAGAATVAATGSAMRAGSSGVWAGDLDRSDPSTSAPSRCRRALTSISGHASSAAASVPSERSEPSDSSGAGTAAVAVASPSAGWPSVWASVWASSRDRSELQGRRKPDRVSVVAMSVGSSALASREAGVAAP